MLQAITVLFLCQLAGEALVRFLRLPFPGPVLGMLLLAAILTVRGRAGPELETTTSVILRNLVLLYIPVSVGIIRQGANLSRYGLALGTAILVSTVLTLAVTALVFQFVARRRNPIPDPQISDPQISDRGAARSRGPNREATP
ncbi:holin-like protein [Faunimonas pinastri]|uniref:Holin-like protein n=1 Tax=Faunimonas pinastri TaxID=1855383 RepID=A0A1H8ZYR1_9HYPH|nr:CidA/LrgA family protein [Faunimonas pinastri]SEP69391.1 holin-like protein [Faunimonas pinastri]